MFFTKKVWITLAVILAVALIGAAIAVTLVMVLDNEEEHSEKPEEPVCDGDRNYKRISLKSGLKSHVEKFQKHGPPPLEVPSTRATMPDTAWITQRIDHFDTTNLETWEMRYMNNSEFFVEGGPMFIFLGGEWEISPSYLMTGQMYDMAKENNGYMFYTEHRYYGQSFPTKFLTNGGKVNYDSPEYNLGRICTSTNMFFTKKIWITLGVIFVVALIGAAVAVTLVMVLDNKEEPTEGHTDEYTEEPTQKPEPACDDDRNYKRISLKTGLKSHVEKFQSYGPPPLEVPPTRATMPDTAWITQRIDHFDARNLETWEMRYMNNSEFFVEGGPMFIFLGGEWEISPGYVMTGQMYDMAKENNGNMFYTEHRYYGQSFPTKDLCVYNLQFASADQAMADIAYFIEYQKSTVLGMENSKVVVVGGSYSAMLATWMRIKYPHLVDAALSSSAPLRAVADFHEYFQVVGDSLRSVSEECVSTIAEAIEEIDEHFETDDGVAHVSSVLGMENPVNTTEPSKSYFFFILASPFASLVQYSSGTDLEDTCSTLLSFEGTAFDKFIAFINYVYGGYIITDYEYYVNYLGDSFMTAGITRQWYYQTCTEYGFYQTSTSPSQPFKNFGLNLFQSMCEDVFGISSEVLNYGIERTNLFYGSIFPEVTKVVSTHGTIDPWHPLGVLHDVNVEAPVFVIEGASHCADLASLNDADSEEMKFAKTKVKEYIAEWIQ